METCQQWMDVESYGNWLINIKPLNIWVAPECGPWSGWNKLNQFKSVAMFDKIQNLQAKELQHVELCSELCRFQVKRSRQFHLEQPNGSSMPQLASFEPIHAMTERASFDMCMFDLKHPVSLKFLRKSSQVFSTDPVMINRLNLARCDHTHVHQPIEGSVLVHGQRMPLTRFCASYCKGFASKISPWMMKSMDQAYVGEHEDMPPAKRFRFSSPPHKRFKTNPDEDNDKSMPNIPEPIDLDPEDQPMEPVAEATSTPAECPANLPKPQSERLEQRRAQFPARKAPDVPKSELSDINASAWYATGVRTLERKFFAQWKAWPHVLAICKLPLPTLLYSRFNNWCHKCMFMSFLCVEARRGFNFPSN